MHEKTRRGVNIQKMLLCSKEHGGDMFSFTAQRLTILSYKKKKKTNDPNCFEIRINNKTLKTEV